MPSPNSELILTEILQENDQTESKQSLKAREISIFHLYKCLQSYISSKRSCLSSTESIPSDSSNSIIKLYTFGSYRLGVHGKDADMDSLAIAPSFINRSDFFEEFPKFLVNSDDPENPITVSSIIVISDTFVPLITFSINNIDFDLLFCQTSLNVITEDFAIIKDFDKISNELDDVSIRSINGARTTEKILDIVRELVPEERRKDIVNCFKNSLRIVKFWAKQRAIYSNLLGYIGGVSYALLLTKSMQLQFGDSNNVYNKKKKVLADIDSYSILKYFFETFANWDWSKQVELIALSDLKFHPNNWNPKSFANKYDKFPILTPIVPTINSSYNVYEGTKKRIVEEFRRANIFINFSEKDSVKDNVQKVIEKLPFFIKYKVFLTVTVNKLDSEDVEFEKKIGFVKSKIRNFYKGIEKIVGVSAMPYTEEFRIVSENSKCIFMCALKIKKQNNSKKTIDITRNIEQFREVLDEYNKDIEIKVQRLDEIKEIIKYVNIQQMKNILFEEDQVIKNWHRKNKNVKESLKKDEEIISINEVIDQKKYIEDIENKNNFDIEEGEIIEVDRIDNKNPLEETLENYIKNFNYET